MHRMLIKSNKTFVFNSLANAVSDNYSNYFNY